MSINIEDDNKDVNTMVRHAKYGQWESVFLILDKKPYLINCIPTERSWATLHQAVYWKNIEHVRRLLDYEYCDSLAKTRLSKDHLLPPGSTALDVANYFGCASITTTIKDHTRQHRQKRFTADLPYFVTRKDGEKIRREGFPLFVLEIINYKDMLLNADDLKPTVIKDHMVKLMRRIFKEEEDTWDKILQKLYHVLYVRCKKAADDLVGIIDEEKFFKELIQLYTGNLLYRSVNNALGRQFNPGYKPTSKDLDIGLYAFLLDLTVCFWEKLERYSEKTYRGVSHDVTDKYKTGQEIMFTTLVSSSKEDTIARGFAGSGGTLFEIDNKVVSKMRPRDVIDHSEYPHEQECLYPLGAEFKIKKVDKINRMVELTLL